ncbi:MAG: hypothetical protein M1834_005784 [Cirrosporium novae-zelandiae]|nr:MAG: hypothetical protein M1834_005784 [Cirrosporium novae-zelandiae]
MPTSKTYGTPSAANDAIGGVPTIHYFDFQSRGRGQVVRLLWEDAGIAYNDVRYSFDEYPAHKQTTIAEMNPAETIPVIKLNGKTLTQSYAILRHFARQLGKYDGQTKEERYWVDAMCDLASDWRTLFILAFFSPQKAQTYPEHIRTDRARFLKALETHLSSSELSQRGPYVIGQEITYADLVIYQVCHDEQLTQEGRRGLVEGGYLRLKELVDAVERREGVRGFLESERYLG